MASAETDRPCLPIVAVAPAAADVLRPANPSA
jgi:hypothetical protein